MNSTNNTPLLAVTAIAIVSIVAVTVLLIFQPQSNNAVLLFAFAGSTVANLWQGQNTQSKIKETTNQVGEIHKMVNSRLTELVASTSVAAKAEGRAEGIQAEQDKQAAMP